MSILLLLNLYVMWEKRNENKGLSKEAFLEKYGK